MADIILQTKNLTKIFRQGKLQVDVLTNVDLQVSKGENIAIVGPSGAGKSTLLHLLGGLDNPTNGEVLLLGQNYQRLSEQQLCQLRNEKLGFVYQFHHLLPEFTALENVMMPLLIRGEKKLMAKKQAELILSKVKLSKRFEHKVNELSGGERQRVAIARALVTKPTCVLADEPTGNLDQHTAETVFDEMLLLNQEYQTSLIIVTHDRNLANKMHRKLTLADGKLLSSNSHIDI
jgi:lipoprotein-releasing system ATP-binding protein